MRHAFQAACVAVALVSACTGSAKADPIQDPAIFEAAGLTNTCPGNCGSVVLGTDPISGIKTVEFELNSTIPDVVAGDVEITKFGSSSLVALLRFEDIGGSADLFLFSANAGGPYLSDVGIPATFQSNTVTISDNALGVSSLYTPTSSQPGFCLKAAGGAACSSQAVYQETVPEPLTLSMFGAGLAGAVVLRRRKKAKA